MVPKIHQKGKSFQGAARYLLGDAGKASADRVAWTQTVNLAVRNPETAWRVMAATAMDQHRLKQQAGIPNTGRKSADHVLHFTLSWHPDEASGLSRDEMLRATKTVLHVMGANDHQALVVCHKDRAPHVHVLVNRVNPRDGRVLSSSFEKLKASRWAEKYEKERGKIFCEERVLNNAARDRGEYTRGKKDRARHVHDLVQAASNDNERRQQLVDQHQGKAAVLKAAERRLKTRHAEAWRRLEHVHRQLIGVIAQKTREVIARNKTQIRDRFRPLWEVLHHEHQAEVRAFEQQEGKFIGRKKNAFKAIDFPALLRVRQSREDGKAVKLTDAFRLLGDPEARRQSLDRQYDAAKRGLALQQRGQERQAERLRKAEGQRFLAEARRRYVAERSSLILIQAMEKAKLKAQWLEKGKQLRKEIHPLHNIGPERPSLTHEFAAAVRGAQVKRQEDSRAPAAKELPAGSRTKPSDLLPTAGAEKAAKQIDQWDVLIAERFGPDRRHEQSRDDARER